MKDLEVILSLSATILGLLIAAITFLVKFIKNSKARKIAERVIKIGNAIMPLITQAEKYSAFSGKQKKAYVMQRAGEFAEDNNIPFNEEQVSSEVERLVAFTKQVNFKVSKKRSVQWIH